MIRRLPSALLIAIVTIVIAMILKSDHVILRAAVILVMFAISTALEIVPGKRGSS